MRIEIDKSYKIKEYVLKNDWDKGFSPEYFEYRRKWNLCNEGILHDIPLFLEVESTYACNYRCKMCLRHDVDNFSNKEHMSDHLLNKLFCEIEEFKIPSMAFSHGGEPLMRKDLPELVQRAKNAGVLDRMFHTNGFLLTKEKSVKLIKSGLTKINFSIDAATSETYNKIRVGGDYNRVVNNIFDFLDVRKSLNQSYPRVRVSFVVQPENKHEIDKFFKIWDPYVDIIGFQELNSYGPKKRDSNFLPCTQLWQLLPIAHNGDVLLCEFDFNHECTLGNLKEKTLIDCWNSEILQEARYHHERGEYYKVPLCSRCPKLCS